MILLLGIIFHFVNSIQYPLVFSTLKHLNLGSPSKILRRIGISSLISSYNILSLEGWSAGSGIVGPAKFWMNPSKYLTTKKYGLTDK